MANANELFGAELQRSLRQIMIAFLPVFVLLRVSKIYPLTSIVFKRLVKVATPPALAIARAAGLAKSLSISAGGQVEDFKIPADTPLPLTQEEVAFPDFIKLPYADHLAELCLLTAATMCAPLVNAGLCALTGRWHDFGLAAIILAAVTLLDGLRMFADMARRGGQSEILLSVLVAITSIIVALVSWLKFGHLFDVPFEQGYEALQDSVNNGLQRADVSLEFKLPRIKSVQLFLVLISSFAAATMLLAAVRVARCHRIVMSLGTESSLTRAVSLFCMFGPIFLALTYVLPFNASMIDPVLDRLLPDRLKPAGLNMLRIVMCVALGATRIGMAQRYVQIYLNTVSERLDRLTAGASNSTGEKEKDKDKKKKKKPEKKQPLTATVSAGLVQSTIDNVWTYTGVVCLQVVLPGAIFMILAVSLARFGVLELQGEPIASMTLSATHAAVCWFSSATAALQLLGMAVQGTAN